MRPPARTTGQRANGLRALRQTLTGPAVISPKKVNYQRALEAELERTIQTMSGVEQVRVHLVLPHESLFTERERPAKAAVVLKLRGMRMSAQVAASSIANLVSSAWMTIFRRKTSA